MHLNRIILIPNGPAEPEHLEVAGRVLVADQPLSAVPWKEFATGGVDRGELRGRSDPGAPDSSGADPGIHGPASVDQG